MGTRRLYKTNSTNGTMELLEFDEGTSMELLEFDERRYERALLQKMYLVGMNTNTMSFQVMGTVGTVYDVIFGKKKVTCTCIDFRKRGGCHPCKHIFFIIGRLGAFKLNDIERLMSSSSQRQRNNLFHIMKTIIQKIRTRAEQIEQGTAVGNGDDCSICLEILETKKKNCHTCPSCNNMFHYDCWQLWIKHRTTCPLCRQNVRKDEETTMDAILLTTDTII